MVISLSWCIFLLCVCVDGLDWYMFLLCVCVDVHWASLVYVFAMCLWDVHWASLVKVRWLGFFYHYRREMIQSGMNEECFYYLSRNSVAIVFGNLVISNFLCMCVPERRSFKVFQF